MDKVRYLDEKDKANARAIDSYTEKPEAAFELSQILCNYKININDMHTLEDAILTTSVPCKIDRVSKTPEAPRLNLYRLSKFDLNQLDSGEFPSKVIGYYALTSDTRLLNRTIGTKLEEFVSDYFLSIGAAYSVKYYNSMRFLKLFGDPMARDMAKFARPSLQGIFILHNLWYKEGTLLPKESLIAADYSKDKTEINSAHSIEVDDSLSKELKVRLSDPTLEKY